MTRMPIKVVVAPTRSSIVTGSPKMSQEEATPTMGTATKPMVVASGLSEREMD
jgi:hypothetical protein